MKWKGVFYEYKETSLKASVRNEIYMALNEALDNVKAELVLCNLRFDFKKSTDELIKIADERSYLLEQMINIHKAIRFIESGKQILKEMED